MKTSCECGDKEKYLSIFVCCALQKYSTVHYRSLSFVVNNAFNVVSEKEYEKEGDAYGNGSTIYNGTDRGRPEKTPKPPGERGWKDTRRSCGISGQ